MSDLTIQTNVSLKPYNTFGIDAMASRLVQLDSDDDFWALIASGLLRQKHLILGAGSNVVFTDDYDGLVVLVRNDDIKFIDDPGELGVLAIGGAGCLWDSFVDRCVSRGFYGVENLAGIPGTVGAAVVQNMGAYGLEVKDVVDAVSYYDIATGISNVISAADCRFGYRDSIFKHELAGHVVIDKVTFRLSNHYQCNVSYSAIRALADADPRCLTSAVDMVRAVRALRDSKLPNPKVLGSAGSFFKNPVVDKAKHDQLLADFPGIVTFNLGDGNYKVAAGWMIERCGWKGRRVGNVGVYDKQALVLVNHGGATGRDVRSLADAIIADVDNAFGITLHPEAIFV